MIHCVSQHNEIVHLIKGPGWFSQYSNLLQAGLLGVQTPMGPRDFLFSTPVQLGFETHLASLYNGYLGCYRGSAPGVWH